jgi:hypothetical protein
MADNFEKSMKEVNTAIKINPVNPIYLHQRGFFHFTSSLDLLCISSLRFEMFNGVYNLILFLSSGYIVSALAKTPQDKEIEVQDYEEVMRRPYKVHYISFHFYFSLLFTQQ